ncbi:hydroxysqualene dehydroxylase HpnE [Roseateles saccharophilus]|uniref:Squalene-associated FAD-dependent desaturase n=1 Tax=Roseateles saccharophilus TaxID=304 RepID=A0A4R3V5H4_ROSSA|nr:hydroxysqualene dehydroxylase HpnE [Roseateles saccharophilus]MDG0831549.1 FAD-dependent oxidoreductase [Roseateles saccharophilus]TCU98567.1 squalene-associated FAD-dependent desaturase [Roseateles saccharophilus]
MKVAVVGGGWAGIAAAVALADAGHDIAVLEMAPHIGGRARSVAGEPPYDNGQHILIGAYRDSLALMRRLGVDPGTVLKRLPLALPYPGEPGLCLPPGPPLVSFTRGVLAHHGWPLSARLGLLAAAGGWLARGFRCDEALSVAELCAGLPAAARRDLVEPLCVAALNTPAPQASARVFLRVLKDALFSGADSADLLLPRRPLSELLAGPATAWLGERLRLGRRVQSITPGWRVDGEAFDAVVLACSSVEAARLAGPLAPAWAATAQALRFEPIVTVYLHSPGSALPAPMLALREGPQAPAQFVFDHGQLGGAPGRFAFVVSGAAPWVERGGCAEAVLAQALRELSWATPPVIDRLLTEKRATFACTPGLARPPARIAPGLYAAGDYIAGPYPATLEGAVRAGLAAAQGAAADAAGGGTGAKGAASGSPTKTP